LRQRQQLPVQNEIGVLSSGGSAPSARVRCWRGIVDARVLGAAVLIDERLGRRTAVARGLRVSGTSLTGALRRLSRQGVSLDLVPNWDYPFSMRVIAVSRLKDFWQRHAEAEQPLRSWVASVRAAQWLQPADITAQFTTASVLRSRRVVFNIKGNDYRLVVALHYNRAIIYVRFVGTHREYDRVDATSI